MTKLSRAALSLVLVAGAFTGAAAQQSFLPRESALTAVALRTEYAENPIGIAVGGPARGTGPALLLAGASLGREGESLGVEPAGVLGDGPAQDLRLDGGLD